MTSGHCCRISTRLSFLMVSRSAVDLTVAVSLICTTHRSSNALGNAKNGERKNDEKNETKGFCGSSVRDADAYTGSIRGLVPMVGETMTVCLLSTTKNELRTHFSVRVSWSVSPL